MSAPEDNAPAEQPGVTAGSTPPQATQVVEQLTDSQIEAMLGSAHPRGPRFSPGWQPPAVEEIRRMLPEYDVQELLASGGMGAVYRGVQKSLDRPVAIKILRPDVEDEEADYSTRFKLEARSMAKLKHPGIVAVHDAGETPEGLLYFVMEFIAGTDVAQLLATQRVLPPAQATAVAAQVCDALACAHSHGVMHRDIKPSNVMLDADGTVKVADFGLAKAVTPEGIALTRTNVAMGTPDYIAPEALIPGITVDHRADIYAVGVMLYQMLTGRIPRGRFELPSGIVQQIDPHLDAIVDKAMQTDREKRYASAAEMRDALNWAAPKPIADARTGTASTVKGTPRRPLLVAGLTGITALVFAMAMWSHWRQAPGSPTTAAVVPIHSGHPYPAGQWSPAFRDTRDIPRLVESKDGWVRCQPNPPHNVLAPAPDGGHLSLHNGGVRAWFLAPAGSDARFAKLEIRRGRAGPVVNLRYIPPGQLGEKAELRIELNEGKTVVPLDIAILEKPLQEGEEFTMELHAVGTTVVGRLNRQTITAVMRASDALEEGALGIWGVDRNFFRDIEVLNLDGLSETEALKLAGFVPNAAPPQTSSAVPTGLLFFGTSRYQFVPGKFRWAQAREMAEAMGGHLATLTTQEEADWAKKTFFVSGKTTSIWLGGRKTPGSRWEWITGEPWNYTDWAHLLDGRQEPDHSSMKKQVTERHLSLVWREIYAPPGGWNDADSDDNADGSNIVGALMEWDR